MSSSRFAAWETKGGNLLKAPIYSAYPLHGRLAETGGGLDKVNH